MSVRELIPSLGAELDELRARLACLEGLLGVGAAAPRRTDSERICSHLPSCNGSCTSIVLEKSGIQFFLDLNIFYFNGNVI